MRHSKSWYFVFLIFPLFRCGKVTELRGLSPFQAAVVSPSENGASTPIHQRPHNENIVRKEKEISVTFQAADLDLKVFPKEIYTKNDVQIN